MKPALLEYLRPSSLDEVFGALSRHPDAVILAGGQSLVAMLNMRLATPSHLVDISRLAELRGTTVRDGWLRLGALVRHAELERDATVATAAPLLRQAAAALAHPAIRNRGTIGGSLAMADPAAELPACVLALGGRLELANAEGRRQVEALEFFRQPFTTALNPGEVLCAIEVPALQPEHRSAYEKLTQRHGDYALAGLAAHGRVVDGRFSKLRLAFFGISDRPRLAVNAAGRLTEGVFTDESIAQATALLAEELEPLDQPGCSGQTKLHFAGVLLRRVLNRLMV